MFVIYCRRWPAGLFCLFLGLGVSSVNALDLNQATRAQLRAIKGVGDKLADRILAARAQGRFASMEDLAARVAGVGPKKLQRLREQGVRTGAQTGYSARPQTATASAGSGKPARPVPDPFATVRRDVAVDPEPVPDLKSAGNDQARRPIPAMPMLIQPRPRTNSDSAHPVAGSGRAAIHGKTH